MGTLTVAPFGTYTGAEICSALGQTEIIANLNSFLALFTEGNVNDDGAPQAHPDFAMIPPESGAKLKAEIDALIVIVEAMPTA